MRLGIFAGCLGMLWMSLSVGLPLTMFMEALGASGVLIGLIATVRLTSMAAQIPGAMLAEAMGVAQAGLGGPGAFASRALVCAGGPVSGGAHRRAMDSCGGGCGVALSELLGNASGAP